MTPSDGCVSFGHRMLVRVEVLSRTLRTELGHPSTSREEQEWEQRMEGERPGVARCREGEDRTRPRALVSRSRCSKS